MNCCVRRAALFLILAAVPGCRLAGDHHPEPAPLPVARMSPRALALASSDLPPALPQPMAGDPMATEIHRLSNGMTVYVSTDRREPRFSAWITLRAGSRHDPADSTGLAHYLEHMLFKGSDDLGTLDMAAEQPHLDRIAALYDELRTVADEERPRVFAAIDQETQASAAYAIPNELDRLTKELGIEGLNAFTSDETTVYIGSVPSNRLEAWAQLEADRFADPRFRLFYPELEAVYEEKNRSIDSPENRMFEELLEQLFPEHPYGTQTTIGRVEHLKVPAYADMVAFYDRWYAPNNMAIVLAGDIDAATAVPVLEHAFGGLAPKPLPRPTAARVVPLTGRVEREIKAEGEQSLMLAWLTVPLTHADEPALSVADWLMDNAASGLLNLELEATQKLPDAGSFPSYYTEAGFWAMTATIRQDQTLAEAEAMLLEVLGQLKSGEFSQADIDAIVLHEEIRRKLELESNDGRVAKMAEAFWTHTPWSHVVARDQQLRAVTRADVMRVATQYFGDKYAVVLRKQGTPELPRIDKPQISPVAIDVTRESPFARHLLDLPAPELEPRWLEQGRDYIRHDLPAGPMIAAMNERNDLFSLSYTFDRGYRTEPLLCHAFDLLERSGAGELTVAELQRKLYALGASVSFGCSMEQSSIAISGIDRHMEATLEQVVTWLRKPAFDDATVSNLLATTLSQRQDEMDDARALAGALFDFAFYGDDSSRLQRPPNRTLEAATAKQLRALIAGIADYQHRTAYYGPRPVAAVAEVVAIGGDDAADYRSLPEPPARVYRKLDADRVLFLHKDVVKADIQVLFPAGPLTTHQQTIAGVLSEYLGGGLNALIPQEIREARGLAYSASGFYGENRRPQDDSGLRGRLQTQVDKTAGALEALFELLRDRPLEATRFTSAQRAIDQSLRANRIDPRGVPAQIRAWDELGEPSDPRPRQWRELSALELATVSEFARASSARPAVIAIVGDRERVDLEALGKLAPVTTLEAQQLFSYGN